MDDFPCSFGPPFDGTPPRPRPVCGVITHVSETNRRTFWTTALKNAPNNCMFPPSHPKILNIFAHFIRAFCSFTTTTGQSLSEAVMIRPSYLNDDTKISGRLYVQKACSLLARISSASSLRRFWSAPLVHWEVLGWRSFKYSHSTNTSQREHWMGEVALLQNEHVVLQISEQEMHA